MCTLARLFFRLALDEANLDLGVGHERAIYLARCVLYMREGIDDGEYAFYQVDGKMNPADGGTKYIGVLESISRRRAWWQRLAMVRVFCYPDYACG